jgi:hypothetical protein
MSEERSKTPAQYIAMHAAGANAQEVFEKARSDGYKSIDCAFIIAGLFELSFREARKIGFAVEKSSGDASKLT